MAPDIEAATKLLKEGMVCLLYSVSVYVLRVHLFQTLTRCGKWLSHMFRTTKSKEKKRDKTINVLVVNR